MERNLLLHHLYACKEASEKYDQIVKDIKTKEYSICQLEYQLEHYKRSKAIICGFVIACIIAIIMKISDGSTFIPGIIGGFIYSIFAKSRLRNQIKEKRQNFQKYERNKREEGSQIISKYAEHLQILPRDYWDTLSITTIIKYLEDNRADNLKEALKLYDEQLHRWKIEEQNKQVIQNQNYIIKNQEKQSRQLQLNAIIDSAILASRNND